MKIGIISNLYPPFVRGGAEVVVGTLAEGLKANLHHVFVISTEPSAGLKSLKPRATEVNGVKVYRFFPLNFYYYINDYAAPSWLRLLWHLVDIFNLHSLWIVWRVLRREKPDLVITHNLMGIGFLLPGLLRRLGLTHIHVVHDIQLYNPSGIIIKGQENNWLQKVVNLLGYPRLMRKLMGSPNLLVSPSQFLLNFYKQRDFFPFSRSLVLRNPVDFPELTLSPTPGPELRLIYLGQVSEPKGILQVVDLIKHFPRKDIRLRVVGLGPALQKALSIADQDERIQFYGWRSHQDLLGIFAQTDILILPSLCYENSPTVIIEALSIGLPVIVANIGGAPELVQPGINGWIFEAGNWKQLQELLLRLCDERDTLPAMSAACSASVRGYNLNVYLSRLLEAISELKK